MSFSITCPNCGQTGTVPDKAAGKRIRCPNCAAALLVPPKSTGDSARLVAAPHSDADLPEQETPYAPIPHRADENKQGSLWSTFGVTIVTVVLILVSIIAVIGVIEIRENPEPVKRLLGNLGEFLANAFGKSASIGMTVVAILVFIAIVAYIPFVLLMAAYVARDAHNRNHSGLGWAAFYLVFQFLGFATVLTVGIIFLVIGACVGLIFGWTGFVIYLITRRSGTPTKCPNCPNKRLPYLAFCPHCGHG